MFYPWSPPPSPLPLKFYCDVMNRFLRQVNHATINFFYQYNKFILVTSFDTVSHEQGWLFKATRIKKNKNIS